MPLFQLRSREVFVSAPAGACVMAASFYTQPHGAEMGSFHWQLSRSDTIDVAFARFSDDNGRTWSEPQIIPTREEREAGVLRRFVYPGYADPHSGKLLMVWMEGLLPEDNPIKDGVRQWYPRYKVSLDGGKSFAVDEPIVCRGREYSASHPLPGHYVGKNATQIPATTCVPITLEGGTILVPCQMSLLGEDGEYFNPGGGHSYKEALVLRGVWKGDGIEWNASERVRPDPETTTRGMLEPTLGVLEGGRILMVLRGSNDVKPELEATKWFCLSDDGGRAWSTPERWKYENGAAFFSPSSCSQLVQHCSGALLWLGNISPQNPKGNAPRFPLVIGEVNRQTGLLVKDSVFTIDTKNETDSERLQLSNFYAREDRETGDVVLHCTRLFADNFAPAPLDWTASAMIYRIAINPGDS